MGWDGTRLAPVGWPAAARMAPGRRTSRQAKAPNLAVISMTDVPVFLYLFVNQPLLTIVPIVVCWIVTSKTMLSTRALPIIIWTQ